MSIVQKCCKLFAKAQQPKTDNERYGPLIYDGLDGLMMGSIPEPIRFCPLVRGVKTWRQRLC